MTVAGVLSTVEDVVSMDAGTSEDTTGKYIENMRKNASLTRANQEVASRGQDKRRASPSEIAAVNAGEELNRSVNTSSTKSCLSQGSVPQFEARTKSIQLLHKLISSVESFGSYCVLDISSEGMCFSISDGHVCKIRLNLNKKVFNVFTFNGVWQKSEYTETQLYGEDTDFSDDGSNTNYVMNGFAKDAVITLNINITSFLETMNIHVKDKKSLDDGLECVFKYERDGDPFVMIFEDECIVERCELNTFYDESVVGLKRTGKRKGKSVKDKSKSKDKFQDDTLDRGEEFNDNLFGVNHGVIDDSVFRIDNTKILFDIIMKSNILHDTIKDMHDLLTERFILYLKKFKEDVAGAGTNLRSNLNQAKSDLIFISKSKADTIGFSKLIVPQRKANIPEFKLSVPVVNPAPSRDNVDIQLKECYGVSLSSTYHFSNFARLLKAIKLSKMIKIRKDMNGITSLMLLLGKSDGVNLQQPESSGLYGSSIEFVTLESVSIDELSSLSSISNDTTLLSKLGYANRFVEQLIKDDREVQTIRVGNDGQLITLDDFFGNAQTEFDELPDMHNSMGHAMGEYIPIEDPIADNALERETNQEEVIMNKHKEKDQNQNILKLTERLTMSLLGHPLPAGQASQDGIQVEKTMIEDNEGLNDGKRLKRASNKTSKRRKTGNAERRTKRGKNQKENDGIETVGGAIEIPLFI
jgi:hypothetical protein